MKLNSTGSCKIALVLYTNGLDYDDRVRKEILSVKKYYPEIEFKIFAVVPENKEESGITSYGVPYRIPFLKSREKYKSSSKILVKAFDFYNSIKKELKTFDYIWCADEETLLFVLLMRKPILWDLHELPMLFTRKIMFPLFHYLERKCKVIVHANEERINHLESIGVIRMRSKHHYLRNYPSFEENGDAQDSLLEVFDQWLGKRVCVYLQGINRETRADYESISAVMQNPKLCAVVVGRVSPKTLTKLEEEYGEELKQRVFFTGMVKQLLTPSFIKRCKVTLVFYKNVSAEDWLCEPNRLYQNIVNGNPVVVGSNPTMKDIVEKYKFGVVIDGDGSDIKKISEGLSIVLKKQDEYRENEMKFKHLFNWESQDEEIKAIVNILRKNG